MDARWFASILLLLLFGTVTRADLPGRNGPVGPPRIPDPPPLSSAKLVLERGAEGKNVRIILPRRLLVAGEFPKSVIAQNEGDARFRTVVAGIALTCSIALAGLWLFRYRGKKQQVVKFAGIFSISLFMIGCGLFRNLFDSGHPHEGTSQRVMLGSANAFIETTEGGDAVKVILPPDLDLKQEEKSRK